jgi:precorrin-6B C5,15-methyltransferase / cobalt-precorrin-6B C5,C15-methyltransferase
MTLVVVGIGADGWAGLGEEAKAALRAAPAVVGSERQLALLPDEVLGERRPWPSPIDPLVDELAAGTVDACVLASGDPMLHGIGATLARRGVELAVHPHPSAFALACARLGWPEAEVELLREPATLPQALQPKRRIVVLGTAREAAEVLVRAGFGPSPFHVLEQLGGPAENVVETTADGWAGRDVDPLHTVAIECVAAEGTPVFPRVPGLPDDAYETDGMLTKWAVRAPTLAALQPLPHALLWDVGAATASIAIEWLRAEPTAQAIAVEGRDDRAGRIAGNARRLGVPRLHVVHGTAPGALAPLDPPDAIFIGGGLGTPGLLDACWEALKPGGRLVANTVTVEGETAVAEARTRNGGALTRIAVAHAEPLGGLTGWTDQRAIVQWAVTKP